jgi:hypothetical protein
MNGNNRKLTFQEWLSAYGDHLEQVGKTSAPRPETFEGSAVPQSIGEPASFNQQG